MAIGTVSNTGGNWSSTASWIGGVIPAGTYDIRFAVTSGPLIVDIDYGCKSIDFTNFNKTITFNSNLTVGGSISIASGVTYSGSNGLTLNGSGSLTSNGVRWTNPFLISSAPTVTFVDYWYFNNLTIKDGTSVTFAGSTGFSVGTFSMLNTSGATHTFHAGNTYIITNSFAATSMPGITRTAGPQRVNIVSSTNSYANIILSYGASCNMSYTTFKYIDSSGGRRIWSWGSEGTFLTPGGSPTTFTNSNVKNISGYYYIKTTGR